MTKDIIPSFTKRTEKYIRQFLPSSTFYVLALDGHKSRNGWERLDLCTKNKCEVIQSPLIPPNSPSCAKKTFQNTVRADRDNIYKAAITNIKSVQNQIHVRSCLIPLHYRSRFYVTGSPPQWTENSREASRLRKTLLVLKLVYRSKPQSLG